MSLTYRFNASSNAQFLLFASSLGHVFAVLATQGGDVVEYKGQRLFQPLQIGLTGKSGSGKSTLIETAVKQGLKDCPLKQTIQTVRSADNTRDVKALMRWVHDDFEIRSQDQRALSALSAHQVELPDFDRPGIRVFEHAYEDLKPHCALLIHFERTDDGKRVIRMDIQNQSPDLLNIINEQFLPETQSLLIP